MKKILFVIPYMYEGGSQRALSNIEMNFPDDWEIETLVNSTYKQAYPLKGKIHTLDISGEPKTGSVLFQFRVFVKRQKTLRKLKKTGEYDACISMSDSANVANILSGNHYCKTFAFVVTSLTAINRLPQYRYIVNPLARLLYNRADRVIAVSEELKCELHDDFGIKEKKLAAVTTGYELDKIEHLKFEEIDNRIAERIDGKKVICNVGRLSFPKGQWHLIRAFKRIIESVPDIVLIIAGDGELREYLEELIANLELTENVILLGHTNNVYKYENCSDVFAFPSLLEGFPNALAEAICVGLPCVATDFRTGAREMLAPGLPYEGILIEKPTEYEYGILTPNCSGKMYGKDEPLEEAENMLADAIITALTPDVSNRYKERCCIKAKNLDIKFTVNKLISIIEMA